MAKQLSEDMVYMVTEFFKTMSDPTRMKIICALINDELCVQDISEAVGMSQTAVSYQLRILRGARLVKFRREKQMVYYSIDDDHVKDIINTSIEHLTHD